MKISIISGSNRKNSQSIKISKIYFEKLNRLDAYVNLINLEKERKLNQFSIIHFNKIKKRTEIIYEN